MPPNDAMNEAVSAATDCELLLQFTAHQQQSAFAELVRRHSAVVYGVCSTVLRHQQDAEDAYQQAFLTLALKGKSVRNQASVAGWLYRVARNSALRIAKQKKTNEVLADEVSLIDSPLDAVAKRELALVVAEEIANLPEQYRSTIVLCHMQGLSRQRAAEFLECTEDSVKARLVRARRTLRVRLARRGMALTFAIGVLTNACQRPVRAQVMQTAINDASSASISINQPSLLESVTNMKITLITISCMVGVALLAAAWPIQSTGHNTQTLRIPSTPGVGQQTENRIVDAKTVVVLHG